MSGATAPEPADARPAGRFEWERAVRGVGTVKPAVLTFGYFLAAYANADGSRIRVGQRALIEQTGYSGDTVAAYMKALRAAGLIERVSRGSVAARRSAADEHRLTVPADLTTPRPPRESSGVVTSEPPPGPSGVVAQEPPPEPSATTPGFVGQPPPVKPGVTTTGPDQDHPARASAADGVGRDDLDRATEHAAALLPDWRRSDVRAALDGARSQGAIWAPSRFVETLARSPTGGRDLAARLAPFRPVPTPPPFEPSPMTGPATPEGRAAAREIWAARGASAGTEEAGRAS